MRQLASRALLVMALGCCARAAHAKPEGVRLSIVGDPTTTIGIAWNTLRGTPEAQVEYGLAPSTYTHAAKATVGPRIGAGLGAVSEVVIAGLKPGGTYYYRVGGPLGGFSEEGSFRTAPRADPECGRFSFVAAGDSRAEMYEEGKGASTKWPTIARVALGFRPAFLLHSGDIVPRGAEQDRWAEALNATAAISDRLPILYAIGNHDRGPVEGEGAYFNRLFQVPREPGDAGRAAPEDYYSFVYGNAVFAVLSTETYTGGARPFADQAAWLDRMLTAHPQRWKFVVLHRPNYTAGVRLMSHPPNEVGQNEALVPLFNKHHVDLVIAGHNHFYERFAPSNCGDGASEEPCPVSSFAKGTVYVTTGGGGARAPYLSGGTDSARLAASSKHHFVLVKIKDGQLSLRAIDEEGREFDRLEITKTALVPGHACNATPGAAGADAGVDAASAPALGPELEAGIERGIERGEIGEAAAPEALTPPDGGCSCHAGHSFAAAVPLVLLLTLGLRYTRSRRRRR